MEQPWIQTARGFHPRSQNIQEETQPKRQWNYSLLLFFFLGIWAVFFSYKMKSNSLFSPIQSWIFSRPNMDSLPTPTAKMCSWRETGDYVEAHHTIANQYFILNLTLAPLDLAFFTRPLQIPRLRSTSLVEFIWQTATRAALAAPVFCGVSSMSSPFIEVNLRQFRRQNTRHFPAKPSLNWHFQASTKCLVTLENIY